MISASVFRFNFSSRRERYVLIVFGLSKSSAAISWIDFPAPRQVKTWNSRSERVSWGLFRLACRSHQQAFGQCLGDVFATHSTFLNGNYQFVWSAVLGQVAGSAQMQGALRILFFRYMLSRSSAFEDSRFGSGAARPARAIRKAMSSRTIS